VIRSSSGALVLEPEIFQPLFEADKTRDVTEISSKILEIIEKNEWATLQLVERSLRESYCWTYIVARKRNEEYGDNVVFKMPNGCEKIYGMHLSTENKENALNYLLKESESYVENFNKLRETGFVVLQDPTISLFDSVLQGTFTFRNGLEVDVGEMRELIKNHNSRPF